MKNNHYLLLLVFLSWIHASKAQFTPLTVTGFNQDLIANGAGNPTATTTVGFDNSNFNFVAQDYSFAGTPVAFLPSNRFIPSLLTPGLIYQLADYSTNNALHFTTNVALTLTLTSPRSCNVLYLLGSCGNNAGQTFSVTVNFSDATTQVTTGLAYADWFNQPNPAYTNIGRVLRTTGALEAPSPNPQLYQVQVPILAGNQTKVINSITITRTAGTGTLAVLAVSADGSSSITAPPIASFANNKQDTIWWKSPSTIVNTSTNASKSYWDVIGYNRTNKFGTYGPVLANRVCKESEDISDCFIDTINNTQNFRYTFNEAGYYRVKVVALNPFGNDTYIDTIFVDTPTSKPVAEFFTDRRLLGLFDFTNLYDLSSNGPETWRWYLEPEYYNPLSAFFNDFSPSNIDRNPMLNGNEPGIFDVCLIATNYVGSDTLCKRGYVRIINGYEVCRGSSTQKDTIAYESEGSAKLYTVGGLYIPNLIGTCAKGFTISTCSDTVTLYMDRFKMRSNVTAGVSDSLRIRVGGPTGAIVARFGGASVPANRRVIKVAGGIAFLETVIANPTSATPGGDSGYVVRWDAPPATYPKPTASFNMPDTVYDGYTVQFENRSTGVKAQYAWDTNGDNIYGLDNPASGIDSTSTNPSRTFAIFSPYQANICLKAFNCQGADTACKRVVFLPVTAAPSTEFRVNRTSGFTTDTFRFSDLSQNGPNQWEWTFVPNNVAYILGTSQFSQNPVVLLNSATNYNVTLTAINQNGAVSATKLSYVSAIAFNTPGCSNCQGTPPSVPSNSDIGISRVVLNDMDTSTALNTPIYHALFNLKRATLYRGVTYTLSTYRPSASDAMSTRAWIDFNRNVRFGDESQEVIISENGQSKLVTTGTFTVPGNAPLGLTRMRIGVTIGNTNINDQVTTLGCFEEYGIEIAVDRVKPVLTLKGSSLEKVEVNKPYVEKGIIATDNLEGDISSRYQVIGSVNTSKLGYYVLKYIVSDLYGNVSDTVSRTVQVEINQSGPSLTLNGSDTIRLEVYSSFNDPGAVAQSNTGSNLTSLITKTGTVDTSTLGTYTITYRIEDQFGFTSIRNRVVMVEDKTAPVISTVAGGSTISHQVGTAYTDPIIVNDNYWKNIQAVRTGVINTQVPGTWTLRYNAVDGSGNVATEFVVTVEVKDMIPPQVSLNGQNPMEVDVFTNFNDPGVTASDNYYPNVFPVITGLPDMSALGNYTVTYTVTDGARNATTVTRLVKVIDRFAPEIEILGPNPMIVKRFSKFVPPPVKLKDNFYSDAQLQTFLKIDTSSLDMTIPGLYFVYFRVTDPSENKSNVARLFVSVEESTTGLNTVNSANGIKVFPNPTSGTVYVLNQQQKAIVQVDVMDMLGKKVLSVNPDRSSTEVTLDLAGLKGGLYFLNVQNIDGETAQVKITVE